jgi:uncharacterized damage-inducible protein DinB
MESVQRPQRGLGLLGQLTNNGAGRAPARPNSKTRQLEPMKKKLIIGLAGLALTAVPTYAVTQEQMDALVAECKAAGNEISVANNQLLTAYQHLIDGRHDVDLAAAIAQMRQALNDMRTYEGHYLSVLGSYAQDQTLTNQYLAIREDQLNKIEQLAKEKGWIAKGFVASADEATEVAPAPRPEPTPSRLDKAMQSMEEMNRQNGWDKYPVR